MAKLQPTFQSDYFSLWITRRENAQSVEIVSLHITDRFHGWRHRPERLLFGSVTNMLEKYLARRPHLDFEHPKNHARRIVYLSSGARKWKKFMPGGFATYPVHNPDVRNLSDGHRVDYVTRNLFRHTPDAIGLRSRAYAMTWYIYARFGKRKDPVRWLSIAAGTGQPTFDATRLFAIPPKLYLTDVNSEILTFARRLSKKYGLTDDQLTTDTLDVSDRKALKTKLKEVNPDVVEMMGLMEYLDDQAAVTLMRALLPSLPKGAVFLFTNMRPEHPGLLTHKHAVGWPGVIQRSVNEVVTLIQRAGASQDVIEVLLPDDNVYAVYCIKQA